MPDHAGSGTVTPPGASGAAEAWALIHVDAQLLVVTKPAGLLSVPGRGPDKADCLSTRVQVQYPDAAIVHRLDQPTSGLMLLARGADMQRQLSAAFERRQVDKRYVAWVAGRLPAEDGEIRLPIGADWADRPRRRIDTTSGRASHTVWRVLSRQPDRTLVELIPLTGRTHQLRLHLAAIGHPIVGDALYGPPEVAAPRLLLHACALALVHPHSGQEIEFRNSPPF